MPIGTIGSAFRLFADGYNFVNPNLIALEDNLSPEDAKKLKDYNVCWDFYDGLHYEGIQQDDKPQTTQNWCRRIVNTFNSAEFSSGVSFNFSDREIEKVILPYLNDIWEYNSMESLLDAVGQMKSVTGDGYIHVAYESKINSDGTVNPDFYDPFDEFDKGRIRLFNVPSSICFPKWADGYDTDRMESCAIIFPIQMAIEGTGTMRWKIVKYVYYPDKVELYDGKTLVKSWVNPYGVIPIVHFKNIQLAGRHHGVSDLADIIPINVELNLKNSDVSEILDYHSAPITCVFGARVSQLEKGANKVWGGLPKDGDVKNLELNSDMLSSQNYTNDLKNAIHEISGVPKIATGGAELSSNLSGVSLGIAFMPLTSVLALKKPNTQKALELVNKLIIKIGIQEGILTVPENLKKNKRIIYKHKINWGELLPRDLTVQLEQIQSEFKMGLESRRGAMERLKKDNIEQLINEIDEAKKKESMDYGIVPLALAAGQILVNPYTGEIIAKNEIKLTPSPSPSDPNKKTESKITGLNKDKEPMKVNSGDLNKNEGKKE